MLSVTSPQVSAIKQRSILEVQKSLQTDNMVWYQYLSCTPLATFSPPIVIQTGKKREGKETNIIIITTTTHKIKKKKKSRKKTAKKTQESVWHLINSSSKQPNTCINKSQPFWRMVFFSLIISNILPVISEWLLKNKSLSLRSQKKLVYFQSESPRNISTEMLGIM